jgi:hypothetical protein
LPVGKKGYYERLISKVKFDKEGGGWKVEGS